MLTHADVGHVVSVILVRLNRISRLFINIRKPVNTNFHEKFVLLSSNYARTDMKQLICIRLKLCVPNAAELRAEKKKTRIFFTDP
jgi:hypothetical protein